MADSAATFADNGHTLIRAEAQLPFVMCTKCGSWGNRRTRGLGQHCAAPTTAGQQALKRVNAGSHPLLQRAARGAPAHRERISIVSAYDAVRGEWVDVRPRCDNQGSATTGAAASASDDSAPRGGIDTDDHTAAAMGRQHEGEGRAEHHPPIDMEDTGGEGSAFKQEGDMDGHRTASSSSAGEAGTAALPADQPCHAAVASAPTSKRRRSASSDAEGRVDYVARAVQQLGATLRRVDTDPGERMRRLRQRIRRREEEANGEEAASQTSPAPADLPDAADQRGRKRPASVTEPAEDVGGDRDRQLRHGELFHGHLGADALSDVQGCDFPSARGRLSVDPPPAAQGPSPRRQRLRGGEPRGRVADPPVSSSTMGRSVSSAPGLNSVNRFTHGQEADGGPKGAHGCGGIGGARAPSGSAASSGGGGESAGSASTLTAAAGEPAPAGHHAWGTTASWGGDVIGRRVPAAAGRDADDGAPATRAQLVSRLSRQRQQPGGDLRRRTRCGQQPLQSDVNGHAWVPPPPPPAASGFRGAGDSALCSTAAGPTPAVSDTADACSAAASLPAPRDVADTAALGIGATASVYSAPVAVAGSGGPLTSVCRPAAVDAVAARLPTRKRSREEADVGGGGAQPARRRIRGKQTPPPPTRIVFDSGDIATLEIAQGMERGFARLGRPPG